MKTSPQGKELVLLGLLFFAAIILWFSFSNILSSPGLPKELIISAVVAAFFVMILWGLVVVVLENALFLSLAWAAVSYSVLFWALTPSMILLASLLFVFGLLAYFRGRSELQKIVGGGTLRPLRRSIPLMVTFLAAVLAGAAYLWRPSHSIEIETLIPEKIFTAALGYAEPMISRAVPGFRSDISFSDYILERASSELGRTRKSFTRLEEEQIVEGTIKDFHDKYGISVQPTDMVGHVVYRAGIELIKKQFTSYEWLLPVAFAVGLFFTFRVLAFPFIWLAIGCIMLLLRILVRLGIVELRAVPVTIIGYTFT